MTRSRPWLLALVCWPVLLPVVLYAAYRSKRPRRRAVRFTVQHWAVLRRLDARADRVRAETDHHSRIRAAGM